MAQKTREEQMDELYQNLETSVKRIKEVANKAKLPLYLRFVLALEYFAVWILIRFRR